MSYYSNSYGDGGSYNSSASSHGYHTSYNSNSSYSSGIWGGSNTVFPPLPGTTSVGHGAFPKSLPSTGGSLSLSGKKPAFKLRRSIHPKAPLTILNELVGPGGNKVGFEFLDVPQEERRRRAWQADVDVEDIGSFECRCVVQGLEFIAEGISKVDAKNAAVELAIQGMISEKCKKNDDEGVSPNEDNCPWAAIASLALYKMYNSWQSQGYTLPSELANLPGDSTSYASGRWNTEFGGPSSSNIGISGIAGVNISCGKSLGEKPPLQIVNEMASRMKLTLDFELTSEVGMPNDKVFTMSVRIAENTYSGQGKNKKSAKQAVAVAMLEDQCKWYKPHIPNELEESETGAEESQPPVKKRATVNEEELCLTTPEDLETDISSSKSFPPDKGLQPGSHPQNVKD